MKNILTLIIISFSFSAFAQGPLIERPEMPAQESIFDHLYFGGGFGLSFGNVTYVEISPLVGYKLTDRFSAGLALKYIYYKYSDDYQKYSTNIYGGGPFARYIIFDGLFLHTEFEVLNLEVPDPFSYNLRRENITSVFVGGGYRQMIGNSSSLDLMLLYNINESTNSPYSNPVIRVGFGFGL
jgi:hypothetical protein